MPKNYEYTVTPEVEYCPRCASMQPLNGENPFCATCTQELEDVDEFHLTAEDGRAYLFVVEREAGRLAARLRQLNYARETDAFIRAFTVCSLLVSAFLSYWWLIPLVLCLILGRHNRKKIVPADKEIDVLYGGIRRALAAGKFALSDKARSWDHYVSLREAGGLARAGCGDTLYEVWLNAGYQDGPVARFTDYADAEAMMEQDEDGSESYVIEEVPLNSEGVD